MKPILNYGYYDDQEIKVEVSDFDPLNYGCTLDVQYDGTVHDIILHDYGNSTWTSIASVYGNFANSYILEVSHSLMTP